MTDTKLNYGKTMRKMSLPDLACAIWNRMPQAKRGVFLHDKGLLVFSYHGNSPNKRAHVREELGRFRKWLGAHGYRGGRAYLPGGVAQMWLMLVELPEGDAQPQVIAAIEKLLHNAHLEYCDGNEDVIKDEREQTNRILCEHGLRDEGRGRFVMKMLEPSDN